MSGKNFYRHKETVIDICNDICNFELVMKLADDSVQIQLEKRF